VRHGRKWHRPGLHAVVTHRLGAWAQEASGPLRLLAKLVHGLLYLVTRNVYGIELPAKAKVGRRLLIGHQGGIVVAEAAEIGDDVLIRQNVTIGALVSRGPTPVIGNRVEIGAGAVVAGGVEIGDDAVVGPNALVLEDVPAGGRALAPPAKILAPGAEEIPSRRRHRPVPRLDLEGLLTVVREALSDEPVDAVTPLLSSGVVDSLNAVVLIAAVEDAYGVALRPDDLNVDVFDTPADLLRLLEERR
jgi:serine O-acetyltransferase